MTSTTLRGGLGRAVESPEPAGPRPEARPRVVPPPEPVTADALLAEYEAYLAGWVNTVTPEAPPPRPPQSPGKWLDLHGPAPAEVRDAFVDAASKARDELLGCVAAAYNKVSPPAAEAPEAAPPGVVAAAGDVTVRRRVRRAGWWVVGAGGVAAAVGLTLLVTPGLAVLVAAMGVIFLGRPAVDRVEYGAMALYGLRVWTLCAIVGLLIAGIVFGPLPVKMTCLSITAVMFLIRFVVDGIRRAVDREITVIEFRRD